MKIKDKMTRLEYERRNEAQRYKPKTYEEAVALFELLKANTPKEVWLLPSLFTKTSHKRRVLLRSVDVAVEDSPLRSWPRTQDVEKLRDPDTAAIVCSIKYTGSTGRPVYNHNINGHFIRPIEET